jgi:hypothetical protein
VENLVAELAFLGQRLPIYQAARAGYAGTGDRRFLTRAPCLDDPSFWEGILPRVEAIVRRHAPNRPLLYDLRDEPSLGRFTSPMDFCFCRHTLHAFRQWLRTQYPSIAALNREWQTEFPDWDSVMPFTTFEIKDREQRDLSSGRAENYAPWADHRAFMDISFSSALDRLRSAIHVLDPAVPVGIAGAQMPSPWGGYDLWRISRAVDWIEPYDIGNSRVIFRSFMPPGAPVLSTYVGMNYPQLRRQAWLRLLNGDSGAIVWDDEKSRVIAKESPALPITPRGKELRAVFDAVRARAARLRTLPRLGDGIAIHYSQASIRAHWMFDSREDGATWMNRLNSYEAAHSRLAAGRDAVVRIVEDLGLSSDFISYEQIEAGDLVRNGYKLLLLPQSVAVSALEASRIEEFVRAGGTVVADRMAATMDEHCRRLQEGRLDPLFGVRQRLTWSPVATGPLAPGLPGAQRLRAFDGDLPVAAGTTRPFPTAPMATERRAGKGRAIYLNAGLNAYPASRHSPAAIANYRVLFEQIMTVAGVRRPIEVLAPEVGVWRYAEGAAELFVLMSDPSPRQPSPRESPRRIRVRFPKPVNLLVDGRDLGKRAECDVDLDPWAPAFIELRPD